MATTKGSWQRPHDRKKYRDNWERIYGGNVSGCCGAEIIYTDICSDCGEHCDAVPVDDE